MKFWRNLDPMRPSSSLSRYLVICLFFLLVLALSSCGDDHHGVLAIEVTPSSPTIAEIGMQTQFIASAQRQHTLGINDITHQVTWASSSPDIATIDSNGLATAVACGTTTVTASQNGAVGQADLLVSCTIPERIQVVVFKTGATAGTITSSPAGINCGLTCDGLFDEGIGMTFTANPTPASWEGCDQVFSGNVCSLTLRIGGSADACAGSVHCRGIAVHY